MHLFQYHHNKHRTQRRGVAIIMVIAFYAVAVAMVGVWVRSALDHQQQVRRWHEKTQATWLAEAGMRRAVARISYDEHYAGERWLIESAKLGGQFSADVLIQIEPVEEIPNLIRIIATAHYPAGEQKRTQSTMTLKYSLPTKTETTGESS